MYGNSALQKPQAIKSAAWIKKLRALICSRASASSSLTHEDREKLVLFSLIYLLAGSWAWLLRRWLSSLLLLTEIRAKKKKRLMCQKTAAVCPWLQRLAFVPNDWFRPAVSMCAFDCCLEERDINERHRIYRHIRYVIACLIAIRSWE